MQKIAREWKRVQESGAGRERVQESRAGREGAKRVGRDGRLTALPTTSVAANVNMVAIETSQFAMTPFQNACIHG